MNNDKEIIVEVLNYLVQQPYIQVHQLISKLAQMVEELDNKDIK